MEVAMDKGWAASTSAKGSTTGLTCCTLRGESCSLRRSRTTRGGHLEALIDEALSFAEEVVPVAVEQPASGAALLLALLWERNQRRVRYFGEHLFQALGRIWPAGLSLQQLHRPPSEDVECVTVEVLVANIERLMLIS
jgi:hypothetical protein